MLPMLTTLLMFQLPMGLLNLDAPQNMPYMSVTAPTFHLLRSWLNEVQSTNTAQRAVAAPSRVESRRVEGGAQTAVAYVQ